MFDVSRYSFAHREGLPASVRKTLSSRASSAANASRARRTGARSATAVAAFTAPPRHRQRHGVTRPRRRPGAAGPGQDEGRPELTTVQYRTPEGILTRN